MYLLRGEAGFDERALRQGDILAGVPFPLLDSSRTNVIGIETPQIPCPPLPVIAAAEHPPHRGETGWVSVQVPAKYCFGAVISNCCDLEPRGGKVRAHAISLARLKSISVDIRNNAERFASLSANKDPRDPADPGYIDYFYMQAHELLQGQDWSVHFSQIVTLPTSDIDLLLRKKILQLDDRTRMKFKIKLAFTVGRPNEDELDAGLEDPWQEPLQPAPHEPLAPAPNAV